VASQEMIFCLAYDTLRIAVGILACFSQGDFFHHFRIAGKNVTKKSCHCPACGDIIDLNIYTIYHFY